jgi:hydrogenase expression/formation protein HypE
MKKLIVASNNEHKIREIKEMLSQFPLEVLSLKEANLNIDPLKFISSGSMLITATGGQKLAEELISKGIEATVIGKITTNRGILVMDGIPKDVLPPTRDELFSI